MRSVFTYLRLRDRTAAERVIDASQPQSIAKTIDHGSTIERHVQPKNIYESTLFQPSDGPHLIPRVSSNMQRPTKSVINSNIGTNSSADIVPEVANGVVALVLGDGDILRPLASTTRLESANSSVNLSLMTEGTSQSCSSYQQSDPRTEFPVFKILPMKPRLQSSKASGPRADDISWQPLPSEVEQAERSALRSPVRDCHQPDVDENPEQNILNPPGRTPPRYILPHENAVNRDVWRYSVDAVVACNRERMNNHYSMHGDGFRNLLEYKQITDPEVLKKIDEIRQQQKAAGKTSLSSQSAVKANIPTLKKTEEPLYHNKHRQLDEWANAVDSKTRTDKPESAPTTNITVSRNARTSPPISLTLENLPIPMGHDATIIIDRSQPDCVDCVNRSDSMSSIVRTPKQYLRQTDDIPEERRQAHINPVDKRAQYAVKAREGIKERWTNSLLAQRRKEAKDFVDLRQDEDEKTWTLWKTADAILRKVHFAEGSPILKEHLSSPQSSPSPLSLDNEQAQGSEKTLTLKSDQPPSSQNSSTDSSFIDLVYTSLHPQRAGEQSQIFRPPTSHAISGYNEMLKHISIGPTTSECQPGPWNKIRPTSTATTTEAQEILPNHITLSPDPISARHRAERLQESARYFTVKPSVNFRFQTLLEAVEYVVESYRMVNSPVELTILNRVYILRLLITREFIPYPAVRKELYRNLRNFRSLWPMADSLGLRPLGLVHFIHEAGEILVFLSTEDDALYLWSKDWDGKLFSGRNIIRAGRTLDECENGILELLHAIDFQRGGWLKVKGQEKVEDLYVGEQEARMYYNSQVN